MAHQPIPVILDCDPGHDDAIAILLAAANPRLDLRAVTTVAGNQTLDKTTLNARRVCSLAGITDVPIAAGCCEPLRRPLVIAAEIHGESGLDGIVLDDPQVGVDPRHAIEVMHDIVRASAVPVTVIAVGPLTNVATFLEAYPDDRHHLDRIVIMGGSTERGNKMPYAEFNIYVDPEAAAAVLSSGIPTTWHGLQVTHQAVATQDILRRLKALGTPLAETGVKLLTWFGRPHTALWGFEGPPLHDPVAVAHVIDTAIVTCAEVGMRIEMDGAHTSGATVVDLDGRTGWQPNAQVGLRLDRERFWDLVVEAVAALGSRAG